MHDIKDFTIESPEIDRLRIKITSTWDRILDIENVNVWRLYEEISVQATFWSLRLDQVKKVDIFLAK